MTCQVGEFVVFLNGHRFVTEPLFEVMDGFNEVDNVLSLPVEISNHQDCVETEAEQGVGEKEKVFIVMNSQAVFCGCHEMIDSHGAKTVN